jgi:hypothetical protein
MLLHHARRAARTDEHGTLIALDKQARTRWNEAEIAEGVRILQAALARDQRGEYQTQAAIAALHDDAGIAEEADWPQILAWYDELLELADNPVAALSRAVAVGEVDGPLAGLSAVEELATRLGDHHWLDAVRAHLHERAGHLGVAAEHYSRAAARRVAPPSGTTSPSKRSIAPQVTVPGGAAEDRQRQSSVLADHAPGPAARSLRERAVVPAPAPQLICRARSERTSPFLSITRVRGVARPTGASRVRGLVYQPDMSRFIQVAAGVVAGHWIAEGGEAPDAGGGREAEHLAEELGALSELAGHGWSKRQNLPRSRDSS